MSLSDHLDEVYWDMKTHLNCVQHYPISGALAEYKGESDLSSSNHLTLLGAMGPTSCLMLLPECLPHHDRQEFWNEINPFSIKLLLLRHFIGKAMQMPNCCCTIFVYAWCMHVWKSKVDVSHLLLSYILRLQFSRSLNTAVLTRLAGKLALGSSGICL